MCVQLSEGRIVCLGLGFSVLGRTRALGSPINITNRSTADALSLREVGHEENLFLR